MSEKFGERPKPLLGPQLRHLRKRKHLSLNAMATLAQTSVSALHRYESGWDRFELHTLRRLAAALGCRLVISLEPGHLVF